jgi:hypothetical protein
MLTGTSTANVDNTQAVLIPLNKGLLTGAVSDQAEARPLRVMPRVCGASSNHVKRNVYWIARVRGR